MTRASTSPLASAVAGPKSPELLWLFGPESGRVVVERPEGTLSRGLFPASSALVIALGALLVIVAGFFWLRQARRR